MFGKQNYKVVMLDTIYQDHRMMLEQKLNAEALEGWHLQSITPQSNEDGKTINNVLIFKRN